MPDRRGLESSSSELSLFFATCLSFLPVPLFLFFFFFVFFTVDDEEEHELLDVLDFLCDLRVRFRFRVRDIDLDVDLDLCFSFIRLAIAFVNLPTVHFVATLLREISLSSLRCAFSCRTASSVKEKFEDS